MDVSCSIVLSLLDLASRSCCIHDCSALEALLPSADMAGSWCSVSACQWDLHMEDTNALSCIQVERLMTAIPCSRMKEGMQQFLYILWAYCTCEQNDFSSSKAFCPQLDHVKRAAVSAVCCPSEVHCLLVAAYLSLLHLSLHLISGLSPWVPRP